MCGIVGVVGNTNATDILIQGLEKLEYRGYDSAGIFVAGDASSQLVKAVGRIAELAAKTEGVEGTAGIGHTRWAGKTTAALGVALRAAGRGAKTVMLSFLKDDPDYGEAMAA